MNHRKRILERILKPNFVGALICNKDILPSKIQLFDITADISINNDTETDSTLIMNYGDIEYNFHITYDIRKDNNILYIINNIV